MISAYLTGKDRNRVCLFGSASEMVHFFYICYLKQEIMFQCIDIKDFNTYSSAPEFSEIKDQLLSSLKIENVVYFGEMPDNDSDGQDELLSDSTYFRVIFENTKNESKEEIIDFLSIHFKSINPKEIILRTDSGETKIDTYIEIYL